MSKSRAGSGLSVRRVWGPTRVEVTRRSILIAGGGLALVASGCANQANRDDGGKQTWEFVDGRGDTIRRPDVPKTLVCASSAVASLYPYGIDAVGMLCPLPPDDLDILDGVDISHVEVISQNVTEINYDLMAKLSPDVIITTYFHDGDIVGFFYDKESINRAEKIAPILGVTTDAPATAVLESYQTLAKALGADVNSAEIVSSRERLDAAVAGLRKVASNSSPITVMGVFADAEGMSVLVPAQFADLGEFAKWGVSFVVPTNPDGPAEVLSWELADKYAADLIIYWRTSTISEEDLAKIPTWSRLPAVEAGQLVEWVPENQFPSYDKYAAFIETTTAAVQKSRKVI